jgi:ABC-type multidrug transport system fused ATPase/permease subunit
MFGAGRARWVAARAGRAAAVTVALGGATAAYHLRSFHVLEEKHLLALPVTPPPTPAVVPAVVVPHKKWTLWDIASPDWLHWLASIVGTLGDALVSLLIPSRIGGIIAALASPAGPSGGDFAVLGVLLIAKAALHFATTIEVRAACEGFAARLKERLFTALLARDMSSFDQDSVHRHLSLITADVRELKLTLGRLLQEGLSAVATVAGGVVMLWWQSPALTALLCATVPVVFGIGTLLGGRLRAELSRVRDMDSLTQAHAGEVLSHIRTVRAFGTEETEAKRYADSVQELRSEYARVNLLLAGFGALVAITFSGLTAATLLVGLQLDQSVNLPAYLMVAGRTQASFSVLAQLLSETQRVTASSDRVLEYLNERPKIPLQGG